ncbi:APC membrane recruitment protein 1 [Rhinophrynus dorsalis]
METSHCCQEKSSGTKSSSDTCDKPESIRFDGVSGKVEISTGRTGSCQDPQTSGKQKKTPFKFFGARKCICTLPSFFGGKHKGQGKGNSRKGLSKSKTHDGISDVQCGDGSKGYSDNTLNRLHGLDNTKAGTNLSSSQSADLGLTSPVKLDFNFHDTSPLGSTECVEKKLNGEKSLSFPRPKKGLKGLFSSIRRHKKNKIPDTEKAEQCDHAAPCIILEQINTTDLGELQDGRKQAKIDCLHAEVSSDLLMDKTSEHEETLECSVNLSGIAPHPCSEITSETDEVGSVSRSNSLHAKPDFAVCSSPDKVFPEIENAEERDSTPLSAGDHISLIFEDVSSLKSFDSFTGCGDIIADQDIDTLSDNAISLERSRETTKRSSCLVTYQGGGEEMATPDDMEEVYLQQLLEDANEAEASYEHENEKEHSEMSKGVSQMEPNTYPLCAKETYVDRAVMNNTELLTPQSDQQESAPNSDEGYYDSTTPGPDDDSGEGFSHKERLPRDSYSGDALYEFYEPDDSLMSPEPGGESLYESKTPCSEIFDQFLDFSLHTDDDLIQDAQHIKGATETEEERLAVIQKKLLFWERQREAALKGMERLHFFKVKQTNECENRTDNMINSSKGWHCNDQTLLENVSKDGVGRGDQNAQMEKQSWKDFQGTSFTDAFHQGSYVHHLDGNILMQNPGFEMNVSSLGAQDQNDTRKANVGMFSNTKNNPMHHALNVFGTDIASIPNYSQENENEQAVNFSQTLVEFTNSDTLFSSISERLGSASSSSSFRHNLDALPTMVTFDIVDVENEGECEHQIDLSPDEEAVESFENFDHSYVQESLADCEEQLFQFDSPQPFHRLDWGVASLPRHLGNYKLSPAMPAPLSLNRRSKSLDTEILELELGGLHLSKSGLKSYDFLAPWEDGKNCWRYEDECPLGNEAEWDGCPVLEQSIQTSGRFESYTQMISSKQGYSKGHKGLVSYKQLLLDRQMAPTTNVPLQCNTKQPQEGSSPCQYHRENTTKKLALVLPLEESRDVQHSYGPPPSGKQIKTKPVGITQAMPQYHKPGEDSLKPASDNQEQPGNSKKEMVEQQGSAPENWSNTYSECTSS